MEFKNVLYVHGYGSNGNSNTAKLLKKYLGEKINVHTISYNQSKPYEALKMIKQYKNEHNIDLLIGTSLGGFMVMNCLGSLSIAINPCFYPSVELPKIGYTGSIEEYQEIENEFKSEIDFEDTDCCYGCFAPNDELLGLKYKKEFEKYFKFTTEIPGGHRATEEAIQKIVNEVIPNYIKYLNAWHEGYRKLIAEGIV